MMVTTTTRSSSSSSSIILMLSSISLLVSFVKLYNSSLGLMATTNNHDVDVFPITTKPHKTNKKKIKIEEFEGVANIKGMKKKKTKKKKPQKESSSIFMMINNTNNKNNNNATTMIIIDESSSDRKQKVKSNNNKDSSSSTTTTTTQEVVKVEEETPEEEEAITTTSMGRAAAAATTTTKTFTSSTKIKRLNITKKHHKPKKQQREQSKVLESSFFHENSNTTNSHDKNKVIFFDDENIDYNNSNCSLDLSSNVTFINCGGDGQTFLTTLKCNNDLTSTQRNVVLKIPTSRSPPRNMQKYNKPTTDDKPYKCISESISKLNGYKRMYQTLLLTSTSHNDVDDDMLRQRKKRKLKQQFYVPIGAVQINTRTLYSSLNNDIAQIKTECSRLVEYVKYANTKQKHNDIVDDEDDNNDDVVVVGTITEVANGYNLNPTKSTKINIENRQRIIYQIIEIWYHMYRNKFLHQDVSFPHIFNDDITNTTSLIDFQRHRIMKFYRNNISTDTDVADDDSHTHSNNTQQRKKLQQQNLHNTLRQIIQVYQLLTLIGNICMKKQPNDYLQIPGVAEPAHEISLTDENLMKLSNAFIKCTIEFNKSNRKSRQQHNNNQRSSSSNNSTTTTTEEENNNIPSLLFNYYHEIKGRQLDHHYYVTTSATTNATTATINSSQNFNKNNHNNDDDTTEDDDDNVILGDIYHRLLQWSNGW